MCTQFGRARSTASAIEALQHATRSKERMDLSPPKPNSEVALQRIGAEAILHDRRNGQAHVLNEAAARIWELCDGQNTLDQIAEAFAASYVLPASAVREDVIYILTKFRELRVLD